MKKIILSSALVVFGMVGSANAGLFTDTTTIDTKLAEGVLAGIFYPSSVTYSHSTPFDFEVPWDTVNSASLSISGYWIDGNNDSVSFEQSFLGTLTPGGTYTAEHTYRTGNRRTGLSWVTVPEVDSPSVSLFNIDTMFSEWSTGAPFDVTVMAMNDGFCSFEGSLYLSTSTFTLDYDNGTAPVPEPSTMLLFGAGALGLLGYSRKRSNKKA